MRVVFQWLSSRSEHEILSMGRTICPRFDLDRSRKMEHHYVTILCSSSVVVCTEHQRLSQFDCRSGQAVDHDFIQDIGTILLRMELKQ